MKNQVICNFENICHKSPQLQLLCVSFFQATTCVAIQKLQRGSMNAICQLYVAHIPNLQFCTSQCLIQFILKISCLITFNTTNVIEYGQTKEGMHKLCRIISFFFIRTYNFFYTAVRYQGTYNFKRIVLLLYAFRFYMTS